MFHITHSVGLVTTKSWDTFGSNFLLFITIVKRSDIILKMTNTVDPDLTDHQMQTDHILYSLQEETKSTSIEQIWYIGMHFIV